MVLRRQLCCHHVNGAVIMTQVISRVHLVHLTNAGQRQTAADPQTYPTDLGCESACRLLYMAYTYIHHYHHLLLFSPKADTHFTVPLMRVDDPYVRAVCTARTYGP